MDRKEFHQLLKSGSLKGAYLFEGPEENLKAAALAALRKASLPEGMEELNESLMDAPATDALIAACETLPFLADQRLVIVREHPALMGRADADEKLTAYIPQVPDSCVLVFLARGKADARKKLYTAIKKQGDIVTFAPLTAQEVDQWIVRTFQGLGKAKQAVFFALFRKAVIVVPLTLLLPRLGFGVAGVFAAEPVSNIVGGLCCFTTMWLTVYRRLGK